jgi:hypothetical protein
LTQTQAQSGAIAQFPLVGRWIITAMPGGWIYVANFGIRQMTLDARAVVASVGLGQDEFSAENKIADYIEKQKELIGGRLKDAKFAGPQAVAFSGAEEAHLLFVRHTMDAVGSMLHAQTYVRLGGWLGIITLTTLEAQLNAVRPDYDSFVKGLRIGPQPSSGAPGGVTWSEPSKEKS